MSAGNEEEFISHLRANANKERAKQQILDTITDVLIRNSTVECPKCQCPLDCRELGIEGDIYRALEDLGIIKL